MTIEVSETEAQKPEIKLDVTVYFHAAVGDLDASFMSKENEELYDRTEIIRHIIEEALADQASRDADRGVWAYSDVRLARREINAGYGTKPRITELEPR